MPPDQGDSTRRVELVIARQGLVGGFGDVRVTGKPQRLADGTCRTYFVAAQDRGQGTRSIGL